jgi:DNA invertase Pin-like site-specific DNA recombinase
MKAIVLARVSDKKQDSNEAQVLRIADYTKYKGLTVCKTYEIEESSTKGDREKFQEVIKYLEQSNEPIALVVDTVDRLQRSFKESVFLDDLRKKGKIEIHFYRENLIVHQNSNSADLLRWDMAVMFARSYVLQLSDNVKRKFEQKRRSGEWTGKAPIGYRNTGTEKNNKNIEPDPDTSHFIVKIFEMYATGNSSFKMVREQMTKAGLRSQDGKILALSMFEHILKNPFYYGEMLSKGNIYPHKYQPIITKQLFDKCKQVRESWGKKPFKYAGKPYVFRGLLTCSNCGCKYTPEIAKGKYVYYSCTNAKHICSKVYIPEKNLLDPVYEALEAMSTIPQEKIDEIVAGLKKSSEAKGLYHKNAIEGLRAEYDALQARLSRALDVMLDGSITKDDYDKKVKEIKSKQHDINLQLEDHTKADENYYLTASTVLSLAKRALDIFKSSEPNEKRALLNYLLQNPEVKGKKLVFSLRSPFNHVVAFSKQPTWLPGWDSSRSLRPVMG